MGRGGSKEKKKSATFMGERIRHKKDVQFEPRFNWSFKDSVKENQLLVEFT